mmetsp:Transcript_20981/g.31819  ORF Transcript_20981/g.31819 Transcript_20981/m.31819 type:complete len:163 (+) Transcript_20981:70-558(+)
MASHSDLNHMCCCSWKSLLNMIWFQSESSGISRIKDSDNNNNNTSPATVEKSMKEQVQHSTTSKLLQFIIFTATDGVLDFITTMLYHYIMSLQYLLGFNLLGRTQSQCNATPKSQSRIGSLMATPVTNIYPPMPTNNDAEEEVDDYGFFVDVSVGATEMFVH